MLQDLSALAPPVIVCVAFLIGAWVLIRRELAPKRAVREDADDEVAAAEVADESPRAHAEREQGGS
jgi:hypothetical protein